MNHLEALDQLDDIGREFIRMAELPTGYRLHLRPRNQHHITEVQLQHLEGKPESHYWYDVGRVNVSGGAISLSGIMLVTYINCTMCGRWADNDQRSIGLRKLFDLADLFEEFVAGKTFDP